jgi:hypothetical protein
VEHTDQQAFGIGPTLSADASQAPIFPPRQSNLDRDLATVLRNGGDVSRLTPVADDELANQRHCDQIDVEALSIVMRPDCPSLVQNTVSLSLVTTNARG